MKTLVAAALVAGGTLSSTLAGAQTVRTVALATNDLVYEPVSGKLYASVPGSAGLNGNSVAVIDPATGQIDSYVWVGSEPARLAASDDGQYLYVGLNGANAVRRVTLETLTPGLQFTLGSGWDGPYGAHEIAAVPGNAAAVAVVRKSPTTTGDGGVALFVDGVMRPNVAPGSYGSRVLAFSSSPGRLYGFNDAHTGFEFFRLNVDDSGIVEADETRGLFSGFSFRFRYAQGLVFGSDGRVADPEALAPVARLSALEAELLSDVVVDSGGLAYAIAGNTTLRAFDLTTWRPVWSLPVAGTQGNWRTLVTAGPGRVAFRSNATQIVVVDFSEMHPLKVSKQGTGNGTVTSTPQGLRCGAECAALFPTNASVTLSATPAAGSSFVGWEGDADCADGVVSASASALCVAVFAHAGTSVSRELPLVVNDIVYSPADGLLYASIPGRDPVLGNSVTAVDPLTGGIRGSVWVGSQPARLALSSDGSTLYVALDGAAAVREVNLSSGMAGLQFRLGRDSYDGPLKAIALAAVPDDPSSVAVVRGAGSYYTGSVAVYTSGIARANAAPRNDVGDLQFGGSASRLYGGGAYADLVRMNVDATGVGVETVTTLGTGSGLTYQQGRLYLNNGRVLDPEAAIQVGTFPLSTTTATVVCPDAALGVVYFLERPSSPGLSLNVYDANRFVRRQSIAIPGGTDLPTRFVATGPGRFAYRTDQSRLFLLAHVGVRGARPSRDFDGDLRADASVYRPATGTWFSLDSSTEQQAYTSRGWGVEAQGDTPVIGDFDGDGVIDPAVFRPATGTWFVLESHQGYTTWQWFGWGAETDTMMPGDYDGDGRTDAAVYRPSTGTWYVRPSGGAPRWQVVFGTADDVPIAGDFDGDDIADIAVYRPSTGTWFYLKSSSGFTGYDYHGWGVMSQGDVPVPGDYDGDGRTDLCVFRPATGSWFILDSNTAYETWRWFGWGQDGDVPAPADYDGDGVTDAAVYRPSNGTWYVRPSSGLAHWSVVFGEAGDVPLLKVR